MSDKPAGWEDISAKRWPFVESPGEFTERLRLTMQISVNLLAAVRTVLIERPPTISKEYLAMATGLGHCDQFNACLCADDGQSIADRTECQHWITD